MKQYKQILGTETCSSGIAPRRWYNLLFNARKFSIFINGIIKGVEIHPLREFSFEGHPNNTTKQHLQSLYNLRVSAGKLWSTRFRF